MAPVLPGLRFYGAEDAEFELKKLPLIHFHSPDTKRVRKSRSVIFGKLGLFLRFECGAKTR